MTLSYLKHSPHAGSRIQRSRKPLRIVGADAANIAGFQAQLDGVEARYVIQPEARSHPDAEAVPPMVTYGRDGFNFVQRKPVGPKSRTEIPPQFPPVHLDGQRGEHKRNGDKGNQYDCCGPLPTSPYDGRVEQGECQADDHNQNSALRMMVRHIYKLPSQYRGEFGRVIPIFSCCHIGRRGARGFTASGAAPDGLRLSLDTTLAT